MNDFVCKFLLDDLDIRGSVVRLGPAWQKILAGRDYAAPVSAMLGEMCAITSVIAASLKQPARLTFQLSGHGPVSLMVIDCTESLNLRAYARAEALPEEAATLGSLLGDGRLLMSLDEVGARQPYQSYVPIEGDSITALFEHYLAQSEQQPARLVLCSDAQQTSGLFLQKLPNADTKDADGWNRITQLASTVKPGELAELDPETLLSRLFAEETVRVFEPRTVTHDFPPDREKIATMLRSLGQAQLEEVLAEHGVVDIHDDLSNHSYRFTPEEVRALFDAGKPTLH